MHVFLQGISAEQFETSIYTPFRDSLKDAVPEVSDLNPLDSIDKTAIDIVITLGGDGTILKAVTLIGERQIPILGVNMGRMGFLATIESRFAGQAISKIAKGMYSVENRSMLYLETDQDIFQNMRFALNDFTLHKRDTSSMVTIHTYINGDYLTSYWADGLIVATPTGSTGYSLSCGGPIVFPNSGNFVITPVAPHNLNVRPIVISDTAVISFEIEGRSTTFLSTLDSRHELVSPDFQLAVRKCDFHTRLILPDDFSFLRTIHDKLTWGKDTRN